MRCNFLLAVGTMGIAGCATLGPISDSPYSPPNPSAVLLQHKGDIFVSATTSLGGESVTGAYAMWDHLGLLASGSASIRKSGDPSGDQFSGELGLGVFDTIAQNHIIEELYGGAGWGGGQANVNKVLFNTLFDFGWPSEEISGTENRNFWKGWMQGATGYEIGKLSFDLLFRIEYVDMYRDATSGIVTTQYGSNDYSTSDTTFSVRRNFWTFTPAIEARYGFDHLQLFTTFSVPFSPAAGGGNPQFLAVFGIGYAF